MFNASSTLTPDSMMSDESESRDWQLAAEPVAGSSLTDVPRFATKKMSESDVYQLGTVSTEATESFIPDDSSDKCERSNVTEESPQLLNRCMLSGIDDSFTYSDLNVSTGSADRSMEAGLNEARLSASDCHGCDSSVISALKGSDVEDSSSKHSRRTEEISVLQPTFSVSIPISTMFEMETRKDENTDVVGTEVHLSDGHGAAREVYSPISDAGAETITPAPSTSPVNRRMVREFSPISPFTPRPSAPNSPLPVVSLNWPHNASSSTSSAAATACDSNAWSIDASLPPECVRQMQQHQSDVIPPRDSRFTFNAEYLSPYLCHSGQSQGGLVGLIEVSTSAAGLCHNFSFQQQQQQPHTGFTSHRSYHHSESRYPGPVFPRHQYHLPYAQQPNVYYADTVSGASVPAHSLYSASSHRQVIVSTAEAGKYSISQSTSRLQTANTVSGQSSNRDIRSSQVVVSNVGHLSAVSTQAHIDSHNDRLQTCHSADTSIGNKG